MRFVNYSKEYDTLIQQYVLTEDQLLYTASPKEAIESLDEERRAILAFEEDLFVSFFVLHEGSGPQEFLGNEDTILLRSFSTDTRHQGKGYGKQIIKELPEFVKEHYSKAKGIVLAVNEDNEKALQLYVKNGYIDEGKRMMGRRGELIILEMPFYEPSSR